MIKTVDRSFTAGDHLLKNTTSIFCAILLSQFAAGVMLCAQESGEDLVVRLSKATKKEEIVEVVNRLSALEFQSPQAQKLMLEKLKSDDGDIRGVCVEAIFFVGEATPEVINGVLDSMSFRGSVFPSGKKYVEVAGKALVNAGAKAMPLVAKRLSVKDKFSYFGLMDYLHRMGEESKELVPELIKNLKPGDLQWGTTYALEGIGKDAKAATSRLIENLKSDDFNIVCITCRALGAIGPDAAEAKSALLKVLKEGNVSERGRALEALGKIGVAAEEDVRPQVVENLKAFHQSICDRTMAGIAALGEEKGNVFIEPVKEALERKAFRNKARGAFTLYKIGGSKEVALETLKKWVKNPAYEIESLNYFGEMGPDAKSALPILLPYLDSEDDYLKALVMEVIAQIGADEQSWERIEKISKTGDVLSKRTAKRLLENRKQKVD